MKIYLLDNAIDSFEWSLRHLRTFLETDSHFENPDISTTYLKQAILCLNSVSLVSQYTRLFHQTQKRASIKTLYQ